MPDKPIRTAHTPGLRPSATLEEARAWLKARVDHGVECPCCTQFAKVYKRKINSSMACVLVLVHRFFRESQEPWLHVPSYLTGLTLPPVVKAAIRGDWAKFAHWGCLEALDAERADGSKRVGFWRITDTGKDFVRGSVKLPKYALMYSERCLGLQGPDITIRDALGSKFHYGELMG
jgi:hypothetical protein